LSNEKILDKIIYQLKIEALYQYLIIWIK